MPIWLRYRNYSISHCIKLQTVLLFSVSLCLCVNKYGRSGYIDHRYRLGIFKHFLFCLFRARSLCIVHSLHFQCIYLKYGVCIELYVTHLWFHSNINFNESHFLFWFGEFLLLFLHIHLFDEKWAISFVSSRLFFFVSRFSVRSLLFFSFSNDFVCCFNNNFWIRKGHLCLWIEKRREECSMWPISERFDFIESN